MIKICSSSFFYSSLRKHAAESSTT